MTCGENFRSAQNRIAGQKRNNAARFTRSTLSHNCEGHLHLLHDADAYFDPIIRFPISSRFTAYVTGGGGYFRRTIEFTKPTIALVPFYDPWFGIIGQVAIPANEVLGRFSKSSGGYDIGAGFQIPLNQQGLKFYSEARYFYVPTEPTNTTFVPVSFGIRW